MAVRMNRAWRIVGWGVAALLLLAIGYLLASGTSGTMLGGGRDAALAPQSAGQPFGAPVPSDQYSSRTDLKSADVAESSTSGAGTAEPMVVRTATLDMRVDKLDKALAGTRTAAKRAGATIEQLSVSGGDPIPRPLAGAEASYPTPASATVTMRVPAARLEALSRDISGLGSVVSQSSSADDVTQQYVDMAARLKNLKTEEARLRSFFDRAVKVPDLLAVEQELSRVRGEIEAMQAQVDYLERQVARATLTVTMTEPGSVVQPSGADWGFTDAIRRGVQAAAALLTTLVTVIIAVAPLAVIGVLAWLVVRWILRRRRVRVTARPTVPVQDATEDDPEA